MCSSPDELCSSRGHAFPSFSIPKLERSVLGGIGAEFRSEKQSDSFSSASPRFGSNWLRMSQLFSGCTDCKIVDVYLTQEGVGDELVASCKSGKVRSWLYQIRYLILNFQFFSSIFQDLQDWHASASPQIQKLQCFVLFRTFLVKSLDSELFLTLNFNKK